ncbi:ATP-binding response regulator [Novipirellula artificiosorum]|uniref:Response regulator PleD n=1 Tax=Novipirellula artificiosorum TaxID=2528016 RepID=A0A5C6DMN8_9BACT|nr:response regulator [Novipirellula artificiosorum]TWU36129.1 Response regulator PleD [Novipirellula artificiosorum]
MARVLLAEDSPTQVVMLKALLEEDSHEVEVAADGAIALDMIEKDIPDIVVTDMQMPNLDGLGLVQQLQRRQSPVPVILIAAEGSEKLAYQALKVGAACYLPKSAVDDSLLDSIDRVLSLMETEMSYKNLIEHLDYNEYQFTLDSKPALIDPLVNLMQQVAGGLHLCDDVERARIGMAVQQALLNAMFHGNLELSRQQMLDDEEIAVEGEASLVESRLNESPYADRKIHFRANLGLHRLEFIIRDEGNGFDTSELPSAEEAEDLDIEGGRGLVMIRSFMDEVSFNEKGNEITMVKRTNDSAE